MYPYIRALLFFHCILHLSSSVFGEKQEQLLNDFKGYLLQLPEKPFPENKLDGENKVVTGLQYIVTLEAEYCIGSHNAQSKKACSPCKITILEKPWVKLSDGSNFKTILSNTCYTDKVFDDNFSLNKIEKIPDNKTKIHQKKNVNTINKLNWQKKTNLQHFKERFNKKSFNSINHLKNMDSKKNGNKNKREVPTLGGRTKQDPNNPEYVALAEESMKEYLKNNGKTDDHKIVSLENVDVQVVAGTLTNIYFKISPIKGEVQDIIDCHSEVLEQSWINLKRIKVNCEIKNKSKRSIRGAPTKKDPNDPQYKKLAIESMNKYIETSGETASHEVISVKEVTVQVVAGTLTKINFEIAPITEQHSNAKICQSEVWEKPWMNFKEIKVNCELSKISKRSLPGEPDSKDPTAPKYKALADESKQKYMETSGETENHEVISIEEVTVQVVAGTLTKITFRIAPVQGQQSNVKKCHSEIWEKTWMNFKEIKVYCQKDRRKRELLPTKSNLTFVGGLVEKDKADVKYTMLAEESMKQFVQSSAGVEEHKLVSVEHVEVQVVAGTLTKIIFIISPVKGEQDQSKKCSSEIWEKPWMKFKEIKVNCELSKKTKRQVPGGQTEQNAKDPKYRALAAESMEKYLKTSGKTEKHEVISVEKVTTQVVSGSLTTIDFKIAPAGGQETNVINCQSKVWEQIWLKFKEITVNCH